MIIVLKPSATEEQITKFTNMLKESYDVKVNKWDGVQSTVLGLIGDTTKIDIEYIDAQDIVENVKRVQEPYKKANRKFHPDNTVIKINENVTIGDGSLHIMAGPCSVESEEQIVQIAKDVKASGATLLRGGAFKPRTSPYAFQGLKAEGLDLLKTARRETGLPIVTEIMRASHIDMFENVDIIQVGARNMQNFELLKELGKIDKPILLKRGLSATIEEWLMSAEYIMAGGNDKVMLCERGIRTYETFTRNTLDISAIPIIKKLSHLPVIVDPSHASGKSWLVEPLAMAAVAAGADGLIIEVHNDPPHALSDGAQSLTPKQFDGNILGPKILGDSTGLPGFWVLVSLFFFGNLFGFIGMVIAVPTFALLYTFTRESVVQRLRKKKLPVDTDYYMEDVEHLYKKNEKRIPLTPEQLDAMVIPSADEVNESHGTAE